MPKEKSFVPKKARRLLVLTHWVYRLDTWYLPPGRSVSTPLPAPWYQAGWKPKTRQALENMKVILEAAGTSLANVVKTTVFLRDIKDFQAMNAIYGSYFPVDPPARSAFQVAALPVGAIVEIECVALVPHQDEEDCCCDKKE